MLQGNLVDDAMSNLTSAATSNEASVSSTNNRSKVAANDANNTSANFHQQQPQIITDTHFFASPGNNDLLVLQQPPASSNKKKRSLPGNPDPEAEVVALSPKSLTATNRFLCEICNKGFQRDQNLQLHRRGHNLPWKLKQRSKTEVVKKKVYICPEPSCVHHEPLRALGDLTGIKKHYFRKHGEKKYKCEKCSKRYAVQSDWKAHSKICGTREYRCDCGTLFSRRDSFITHRAFCDALAEESSRSMTQQSPLFSTKPHHHHHHHHQIFNSGNNMRLKQEITNNFNHQLPPWLSSSSSDPIVAAHNQQISPLFSAFSQKLENHHHHHHHQPFVVQENPNNSNSVDTVFAPPPMSATALLRKAAQMGGAMMNSGNTLQQSSEVVYQYRHVGCSQGLGSSDNIITAGLSSPREVFLHGLASLGNDVVIGGCMQQQLHDHQAANINEVVSGVAGNDLPLPSLVFEDNGLKNGILNNNNPKRNGNNEGLTRDFLGLRAFPNDHRGFINITLNNLDQMGSSSSSSYDHHLQSGGTQDQAPWQS